MSHNIRIVTVAGEPWFVVTDVCRALKIVSNTRALNGLDPHEKGLQTLNTLGGPQTLLTISESGLFTVLLRSYRPEAKPFRQWVTGVVLPSIRATGSYVMNEEKLSDPALPVNELEALNNAIVAIQEKKAALLEARLEAAEAIRPGKVPLEVIYPEVRPTVRVRPPMMVSQPPEPQH